MDAIEEYAKLKQQIGQLQDRAEALRESFLQPGARLRSNRTEIVLRKQSRRVFVKDRLPQKVLDDPAYWEVRENMVVTLRSLGAREDDVQLIEPF